MKKIFLSTIALAMVFAFTSCKDDTEAPVITLPEDASIPVFELGDNAKALEGVTAEDKKDGDVTANITIDGLQYVAENATLVYSVQDEAGNVGEANRTATVSASELFGNYVVSQKDVNSPDDAPVTYTTKVSDSSNKAALVIENLGDYGYSVPFVGTVGSAMLVAKTIKLSDGSEVNGTCTYSNNGTYALVTVHYTVENPTIGTFEYEETFFSKQ